MATVELECEFLTKGIVVKWEDYILIGTKEAERLEENKETQ